MLLTTFTPTGRDHALRHLPHGVRCALLPFDLPGATRRFMGATRPQLGIIVETEIWPNLYAAAERMGVPLMVVSARVTEYGAQSYRRWRGLVARTLSIPVVISAQSDEDAARIQSLGADPTRVTVGGNMKFDFRLPDGIEERAQAIGEETGLAGRECWIAASTHPGEEEVVLDAHRAVLTRRPGTVLVLAPRHPGRAEALAQSIAAAGFVVARRSQSDACTPETQVYLLDTLGELAMFYSLTRVAFVGGTLVPVGGHNLLEPAAFGLPVLCGPHVHAVKAMHKMMVDDDALETVTDAASLADALTRLLADGTLRVARGETARRVLERNRGAVDRVMRLVSGFLPD